MSSPTDRIVQHLSARGVPHTIHEHEPARTVADALERLPFSPEAYLKTVAFRLKAGGWVLAALRGADRVDYRALAAALGVGRRDLHQLSPDEVVADLGYPIGGVGPVPPNVQTRTIFDQVAVETLDTVFCGAGREDRTLEARVADLVVACDSQVAPIAQSSATSNRTD
ncbi:MAG: aminoacyl-tRNA deacylase [Chloroflexota bacterium]